MSIKIRRPKLKTQRAKYLDLRVFVLFAFASAARLGSPVNGAAGIGQRGLLSQFRSSRWLTER